MEFSIGCMAHSCAKLEHAGKALKPVFTVLQVMKLILLLTVLTTLKAWSNSFKPNIDHHCQKHSRNHLYTGKNRPITGLCIQEELADTAR